MNLLDALGFLFILFTVGTGLLGLWMIWDLTIGEWWRDR